MQKLKDIDGKEIKLGHILAVRYGWNSYIGIVRPGGLSMLEGNKRFWGAAAVHALDKDATYQIISHVNPTRIDYNKEVNKWYMSDQGNCPIKIRVYENYEKISVK